MLLAYCRWTRVMLAEFVVCVVQYCGRAKHAADLSGPSWTLGMIEEFAKCVVQILVDLGRSRLLRGDFFVQQSAVCGIL